MKLLRVGGTDEIVSIGAVISLAFRNSMTSWDPVRVSCVAELGCIKAGELALCSVKSPAEASSASASAMQPETIKPITGKLGRRMILSGTAANLSCGFLLHRSRNKA